MLDVAGSDAVEANDDVDDDECDDTDVCCCSNMVDMAALMCDTDVCLWYACGRIVGVATESADVL